MQTHEALKEINYKFETSFSAFNSRLSSKKVLDRFHIPFIFAGL